MRKAMLFVIAVVFVSMISCGSKEVKKDTTDPNIALLSTQNQQLSKYPVDGFDYKSSKLSTEKWDRWAKGAAPIVKEILGKLPEGYVLQVTGHTDASGPEKPEGDKPGNLKISEDRAKTVYNALKKANITSPKLTYKGIGSSELLSGVDPRDAAQRRVTFKAVSAK